MVKIKNDDTEETLSKRILAKEHKAYPEAVRLIAEKKIQCGWKKGKNSFLGIRTTKKYRTERFFVLP